MNFVKGTFFLNFYTHLKASNLAAKLSSGAKGTRLGYENIAQMPFPVFTVCPAYPYKSDRLAHHGVSGARDIQVILWHCLSLLDFTIGHSI